MDSRNDVIEECARRADTSEGTQTATSQHIRALKTAPDASAPTVPEGRRQAWRAALCTHAELAGRSSPTLTAYWKEELRIFDAVFPAAAPAQKGGES